MSDREGTPESRESGAVSPSRSRSLSGSPSRKSVKSEEGSVHSAAENGEKSPQRSRSRSRSPRKRSYSRSRSRSYERKYRSRSRSRSRDRKRYRSRSRSRSRSRKRYSRSRSRSPRGRRRSRHDRRRSYSRSPMSRRRRHQGSRDNPRESRCLGVFGLSLYTEERDIRDVFERYGPLEEVQVVYDHQTGRSRGFSFVYFRNSEDAVVAKDRCTGIEIDGRRIRVDFSITERAHTPTPGIYLGKSTRPSWRRSPSPHYRRGRYSRSRTRSRSYSPRLEERIKENET